MLRGPNTGARFLLDDDEVDSGRHPDSDIFLDDVTVSRKHAVFRRTRATASSCATSARSTAPTSTASSSTRPRCTTGDEVQIGKFRLVFYAGTGTAP